MTSRQCVANIVCFLFERLGWIRKVLSHFSSFMFPTFFKLPIGKTIRELRGWRLVLGVYLFVWIPVFLVQAILALNNGQFFPDSNPITKMFLEDTENLINYLIICEAYCLLAFLYLRQAYTMGERLRDSGLQDHIQLPALPEPRPSSFIGGTVVLLFALFGAAGYAIEIKSYSNHYWFMDSGSFCYCFNFKLDRTRS